VRAPYEIMRAFPSLIFWPESAGLNPRKLIILAKKQENLD
jgi:hypothetical protein